MDESNLKGIQVFFEHPWAGSEADAIDSMVAEFNRDNPWGIMVVVEKPGSSAELINTLEEELGTSTQPDIIAAPIESLLALNQNDKVVIDLGPYVGSGTYGLDPKIIDAFSPVIWAQDSLDGYRYGIPAQRTAKVMIYNRTWAKELGFDNPPATPEDFEKQTCAAYNALLQDDNKDNNGLGGWVIDTDAMTLASWAAAFGTDLDSNGQVKFSTEGMKDTFTYLRKLEDEGCTWVSKEPAPYNYFDNRQALVYSADLQDLAVQTSLQAISGGTDQWEVIPFPTKGEQFVYTYGPSYAILKNSEEKQLAAWLFIRWMTSLDHEGALVKAGATLPMGEDFINYSIELEDSIPQWGQMLPLLGVVKIPPQDPQWTQAKMILEDAGWQLFKTDMKPEDIPGLLAQMDSTLKDLEGK
jgi:ABC-type glycerol-3-phosphate transport system substrate-binding protein